MKKKLIISAITATLLLTSANAALANLNVSSAGISMPTKVISGTISSSIPTARTMSGEIEYDKSTSSLKPIGTQVDMYTNVSLNKNWELAANYTQDMMNIEGMNNHSVNLNYVVRF